MPTDWILPPHKQHVPNTISLIAIPNAHTIRIETSDWTMLETWVVMLVDYLALNDVNINRSNRGALLFIAATKKDAINIPGHMDRQWIGGVRDQLWMPATFLGGIKLTYLLPTPCHIPLNLVLGTFDRSVPAPM